ncbi:MAG: helix-turn-helix domain-containing protein [Patescibacteria group bacterium]|nr:helix-turn-helix domain-containing protein [Patescibacteria group bacterium]
MSDNNCSLPGPVFQLFGFLSKRWMLIILTHLCSGNTGFNQIKASTPGLSAKILSQRLSELEDMSFVQKNIISQSPLRTEYLLTEKAKSFRSVLENMGEWGEKWEK